MPTPKQTPTPTNTPPTHITIDGVDYPLTITMGAFLDFKTLTGREAGSLQPDELSLSITFIYCIARSAARRQGLDFPFSTPEAFADHITPDQMAAINIG